MANKHGKQSKKDPSKTTASDVSMAALTSLLEGHKADLATEFKASFLALEAKIHLVQAPVSSHGQRITSLETNADSVDERLLNLEASCAELTAVSEKLKRRTWRLEAAVTTFVL